MLNLYAVQVVPKRTNLPGFRGGRGRGRGAPGGRGGYMGRGGFPLRGGGYRGGYRGSSRGRGYSPY